MTDSFSTRRSLALWFPTFPSDRWRREHATPPDPDVPACIVARIRGARRVEAGCARAAALGLVGLSLADARARVPDLVAIDEDPAADAALLERLADLCLAFTPVVALDAPDGLLLDITGCEHHWGGEARLAEALAARIGRGGVAVRHALATAPDAARALARFAAGPAPDEAGAVRRLPIDALGLEPEAATALRRAGLRTVGDLASRPLASLAARFGADAVTALRCLLGEAPRALKPHRPPPAIRTVRRFADPINTAAAALGIVAELAAEAAEAMAARGEGARRFEARLFRADGHVAVLAADTSIPTRDPALLNRLLAERVERLRDPLDPGFGYDAVTLAVPVTEPLPDTQLRLDGGALAEAELAALTDRLAARLGSRRVRRLAVADTHIPERAQLSLEALDCPAPPPPPELLPGDPPSRPLTLFDPPQPIEVIAEVPDGPPHRFRWRRTTHLVARFEGPERIAPEWWRRRDGALGGGRTRDYYRVEDTAGRRYWLFRHGLYEEGAPVWYLHGLFA